MTANESKYREDSARLLNSREEAYLLLRENTGWLCIATKAGDKPLKLSYAPHTQRFEGTEVDPEVVPVPGELQPRRSPLAVIVSEVLKQIPPSDY
jgi:hypothetical protein